ncbi:hypothetical protein QTP88_000163 [Uroleucon formosanum]
MPAIERVLQLYVPLKKYFLSIKKCPTVLKNFFECPTSELWLFFVHSQSVTFHIAVLRIEGQNISAIEAAKVINELRANLEEKLSSIFLPYSVRRLLSDLQKKGEVQEDYVKSIAWDFYKTTTEYLQQWTSYNQSELQIFKWVDLRKILTWVEVQKSMDVLIEKGLIGSEQDTEVFDEFTLISSYVSDKVEEWNSDSSNKYAEHRWIEVFQYFRDNNLNHTIFQKIVEYVLCMPATNAPVERIFSLMNNLWTAEKTQLQVSSLKAMLLTKVNFKMSCTEFYSFLKSSPDLLQQICSNEKYTIMRQAIPAEERLIATGKSYEDLKFSTGIAAQTLGSIIPETCKAIYEILQDTYMKVPQTSKDWKEVANGFKDRWQMINCGGCIDGKHIRICQPARSGALYYNYKNFYSIVLMAIVNHNYELIYVDVGKQGRISDGGVIQATTFYRRLQNETLNLPKPMDCEEDLNVVFIGDAAFSIEEHVLKPFPQKSLNYERRIYNYRLSRARNVVENAFGLIASRFRILQTSINVNPNDTNYIVLAICTLHNFLIKHNSSYVKPTSENSETQDTEDIDVSGQLFPLQNCKK